MKHVLFILVFALAGYAFWQLADKKERADGRRLITYHGIRVGLLVLVVLALLALAYYVPSTNLL